MRTTENTRLVRRAMLAAVLGLVAFLAVTQPRTELLIRRQLRIPSQRLEELAFTLRQQDRRADALERQVVDLRAQVQQFEQAAAEGQTRLAALRAELQSLRVHAGLTAL